MDRSFSASDYTPMADELLEQIIEWADFRTGPRGLPAQRSAHPEAC